MLSKCLNPTCLATFRYLRDGRVFHLEVPAPGQNGTMRRREYFWLFGRCCATFTIVVKDGTPAVRPRFIELTSGERMEESEEEKPFFEQPRTGSLAR